MLTQLTDAAKETYITCLRAVVRDELWQDFGFPKRPRIGQFFKRFRPAWKNSLENRIMQEILASWTAVHVVAGKIGYCEVGALIDNYTTRSLTA